MLKIAYWGSMHGQPGATSNLLATSIYMCAAMKARVAVLQSHFSMNNLSYPLIGLSDGIATFRDTGIDALLRDYKSRPLTEDVIISDGMSLLSRQYSLFSGTGNRNKDTYEKEMLMCFNSITEEIAKYNDYVFIDISSGYSRLSQKIVKDADILVINMSQNRQVINEYINEPIEHDNIIYLFGNYNKNSKYNLKNLSRMYPAFRKNSYSIFYNVDFQDAQNDGKTIEFMLKNLNCSELSVNYDFMQSVKMLSEEIKRRGDEIASR